MASEREGLLHHRLAALSFEDHPLRVLFGDAHGRPAVRKGEASGEVAHDRERIGLVHGARETVHSMTGRSSIYQPTGDPEAQLRWFRITTSTVMVQRI